MMVGAVVVFCRTEHAITPIHGCLSDFLSPSSHVKSAHLICKAASNIPPHRHNSLNSLSPGGKPAPRTIVYGLSRENEDAERHSSHHFIDDTLFLCSEDDRKNKEAMKKIAVSKRRKSKEVNKELASSVVESDIDLLPFVIEHRGSGNLLDKLNAIQLHLLAMEQWNASRLKACHKNYSADAANLIHYLALKSLSMEQMQQELFSLGLLNLRTVNPHVLSSLSACIQMLKSSIPDSSLSTGNADEGSSISTGFQKKQLAIDVMMESASSHSDILLGRLQGSRTSHIMVTVGNEAVENDAHIPELINAGTSIIRINCAHGNTDIWNEIIRRVKKSSQHLEKPCRVLMDLAGPKLRTGRLKAGPCVIKISPKKDVLGRMIRPAQVWLSPQGAGPPPSHVLPDVNLHIDGQDFLSQLKAGDSVRFTDARGNGRTLRILSKCSIFSGVGYMAECSKTAYVESGTTLHFKEKKRKSYVGFVVDIPPTEQYVRLRVGDLLKISRDSSDEENSSSSTAAGDHRITCPSGYLFDSVKPGDPIAFDDGKIWGVIKGTSSCEVVVSITHAGLNGTKLGSEKSINIPESDIKYEGLTSKDLMDLEFVAANADMVGISFVRDVSDIVMLRQELTKRKLSKLGIVLKIETKGGLEKLPLLILEAMKSPNPLGVMIARGDLAVECGWEKLADIQEEIFSICSAAHVPVILATQVLESLIKSGVPTRAEITDAANGRRASCVMLNKGKNVLRAVSTLDAILNRENTQVKSEVKPLLLSSHAS